MNPLKLRDRDAIVTRDNIIFRVYGYAHPSEGYICDPEYAPESIFESKDPRALRTAGKQTYYKFYSDEGIRFVHAKYPQYRILYEPLQEQLVGVSQHQIWKTRKPNEIFQQLMRKPAEDSLHEALRTLSNLIMEKSGLSLRGFGVFGSLLHGFYHPKFSDLDLIIYGRKELRKLCETLEAMYKEKASLLQNEFESIEAIKAKSWNFINYSPKEYLWHQKRKSVYALFKDERSGRTIKTEFEPVKNWSEIQDEYSPKTRIVRKGWIRAVVHITDDQDAAFMPSIYQIEPIKILQGEKAEDIKRIISYMEEFRMQVQKDEKAYVEGNLEQVNTLTKSFHQITLTYAPRYYEQVLKIRH
ncbi:MAG: nucleotidyltransferase domain-containing protein [Candidatus Bathyarchaeia archaeon]